MDWTSVTTVMIRNVPNYSTEEFLKELWMRGFAGSFDFFYLPVNFQTGRCKGYAYINFLTNKEAVRFYENFNDQHMLLCNKVGKRTKIKLFPSTTQGLHANIQWYLQRRSYRTFNPWFQPLLFPQVTEDLIAYPLYQNHQAIGNALTDTNYWSDRTSSFILKLMGASHFGKSTSHCALDVATAGVYRLVIKAKNESVDDDELEEFV